MNESLVCVSDAHNAEDRQGLTGDRVSRDGQRVGRVSHPNGSLDYEAHT